MNNYFDLNIKALIQINPLLAVEIMGIRELKKYEVFVDEADAANINIVDKELFLPLYNTRPIDETIAKIESYKKYSRYPYLYFFGIGNGIFFQLILASQSIKKVVIIEKELELLYIAFNFNNFAEYILSGKLEIYLSEGFEFSKASKIVNNKEARLYLKTYFLEPLSNYYSNFSEDIIAVNKVFTAAIEHSIYALGNDANDALLGLQHHIQNIHTMIQTPTLEEFVTKAKTTPLAVIVSTGPSLAKQLPLLKEIQEYVTIFCIDASFPILFKNGIKPDTVVSLERIFPTSKFFSEMPKEAFEDVVFNLTSIQHKSLIKNIKSGTMQISMRPFGYTRYFGLDKWGYAGIGMSAANFAFELIYHSKFEQVAIIGQDLAYGDDGTSHTAGHMYGINDVLQKESDIMVEAYGGGRLVRSTKIWELFKNFYEADIYDSKERLTTYNCTEGGARISGAIEEPFEVVVNRYIDKTQPKKNIVLTPISVESIEQNKEIINKKIEFMLDYSTKKLHEVKNIFLKVVKECEVIEKNGFDSKKLNTKRVTKLIDKIDTVKDNFNDLTFMQIFNDSMQAWIITQELELAKIQVRDVQNDDERKQKLQDWLLAHKFWLFSVAGSIEATREAIFYGLEEAEYEPEFLDKLISYYDGDRDDYNYSKIRVKAKDIIYGNKDIGYSSRIEYVINKVIKSKEEKIEFFQLVTQLLKEEGLEYRLDVESTKGVKKRFTDLMESLQLRKIEQDIQGENAVLIYIKDDIIDIDNNRVINGFMRFELENIIKEIGTDYKIIIAIDKPLFEANEAIDGIMDNIPDIEKKYSPYLLGLFDLNKYDMFDYIITVEEAKSDFKDKNNLIIVGKNKGLGSISIDLK